MQWKKTEKHPCVNTHRQFLHGLWRQNVLHSPFSLYFYPACARLDTVVLTRLGWVPGRCGAVGRLPAAASPSSQTALANVSLLYRSFSQLWPHCCVTCMIVLWSRRINPKPLFWKRPAHSWEECAPETWLGTRQHRVLVGLKRDRSRHITVQLLKMLMGKKKMLFWYFISVVV